MAYATVDDVKLIWSGFPTGQEARAAALLDDAAVRIDAYAPPPAPPEELTDGELAVRKTVSREMVVYVMMADAQSGVDPVTQKSRTMGPFSESWTFDRPGRTLMLTDEQKSMLVGRTQRAYSVSIIREPPPASPLGWPL